VNVQGPAPVITLGDAGSLQVAIQNPQQPGRHVEKGQVSRQPYWDRLAVGTGIVLAAFQLLRQPDPQVGCQVIPHH
jgi:hypothetical protein